MGCSGTKDVSGHGEVVMTYEDIENATADGRKLVVYEDIVIDVTNYIVEHPGGADSLERHIGKEYS